MFVVCCVGSDLCDGLISPSEVSYWMRFFLCIRVCLIVCDLETSTMRRPGSELGLLFNGGGGKKVP